MALGKGEMGSPSPAMLGGLGAWGSPVHGTAAPHLNPLQQHRPEPTLHRSPLIRPGVAYAESDTMTPNH